MEEMIMKKLFVLTLLFGMCISLMADRHLYRYGWENVGTGPLLGEYRPGDVIESVDTTTVHSGAQSLKLIDNDTYNSDAIYGEQAYICFINGLQEGDVIQGSFWRYNESLTAGCRISANYAKNGDTTFGGYFSDGDNTNAGIGTTGVWEKVSYSWVFSAGKNPNTGIMVLARNYRDAGDICYVDDLEVIIPERPTTTILFPGTPDYDELIIDDPNALQERSYGWEDGFADVLSFFGNVYEPRNTTSPDPVYTGTRSLKVTEFPMGDTPEVGIAFITGLQDGDLVTAGFSAYDVTANASPSIRIWGNYANSADLTSYLGSAGGNETYSGASTWTRLENTWTFSSGDGSADALMITARLYSPASGVESQDYFIDDVNVVAPLHATIIFPADLYLASDYTTSTYTWGNFTGPNSEQNVLLGTFGMVNAELDLFDSHNGDNKALSLSDATESYTMSTLKQAMNRGYEVGRDGPITPEGYVAVVKGLSKDDFVKAAFWAKRYTGQLENTGVRLWAHYIYDENDLNSFAGSAGGFAAYAGEDWTKLSYRWVFNDAPYMDWQGIQRTPVALVITARAYSANGEGGIIDDVSVEAPVAATVQFPDPSNAAICVGGLPEYDFNLDCKVNLLDFADFASGWLSCNLQPSEDCGL
jgi:hypothetical protein